MITADSFAARLDVYTAGQFRVVEFTYDCGYTPHGTNRSVALYLKRMFGAL